MDGHAAILRAFDHNTHVTERLQGCQRVFTFEETLDFGRAFGQRAEHDRAVGNRFVAWNADTSANASTRISQENQVVGVHSVHISPAGKDFTEMLASNTGASEYAQ